MTTPTDKPAFPYAGKTDEFNRPYSAEGMTLREYYAGLAMQALLSHPDNIRAIGKFSKDEYLNAGRGAAAVAFDVADSMLLAAQKAIGHQ